MTHKESRILENFLAEGTERINAGTMTEGEKMAEVDLSVYETTSPPKGEPRARRFMAALLDELLEGIENSPNKSGYKGFLLKLAVKAILVAIRAIFKK